MQHKSHLILYFCYVYHRWTHPHGMFLSGLEACIRPIRKDKERFARKRYPWEHLLDAYRRRWLASSPRINEFDFKRRDRSTKEKPNPIIDNIVQNLFEEY